MRYDIDPIKCKECGGRMLIRVLGHNVDFTNYNGSLLNKEAINFSHERAATLKLMGQGIHRDMFFGCEDCVHSVMATLNDSGMIMPRRKGYKKWSKN